jgi:HSP20 family protein
MNMSSQKFDPVKEFSTLRDTVSRALGQSVGVIAGGIYPLVDVYETEGAVVVSSAPLDGKLETIDVSMEGDLLLISGETRATNPLPTDAVLLRERRFGKFSRALRIPRNVNAEAASARYSKGVLTITLPKVEVDDSETGTPEAEE